MALVPAVILIPTRLLGMSVTLAVAVGAPVVVFFGGLAAYVRFGAAKGSDEPLAQPPTPLSPLASVLLIAAFGLALGVMAGVVPSVWIDRKSTRLNSSHANISYAVFCLKKKKIECSYCPQI